LIEAGGEGNEMENEIELKQLCSHCGGDGMEFNSHATGRQIRHLREQSGISLRELARRVGWSAAHQHDLEKGHRNWTQAKFDKCVQHIGE
jgi:DNA-binding transcriptional regulator YiaG